MKIKIEYNQFSTNNHFDEILKKEIELIIESDYILINDITFMAESNKYLILGNYIKTEDGLTFIIQRVTTPILKKS